MSEYLVALLKAAAKSLDKAAQDKAGLFEYRRAFKAAFFGSANYYGDRIQDRVPKALRALMRDSAACKLIRAALPDWTTYRRKWIQAINENESDSRFPLDLADDDMREAPSPEKAALLLYLAGGRVLVANMEKVFVAPLDWPGLCLEKNFSLGKPKEKPKILSAGLLFRFHFDGLAKSNPQYLAEALASAFRWAAMAQDRPGDVKADAAVTQADGGPFYKPSYFQTWGIGDELLRRNSTDKKKYVEGKVRRQKKKPATGKGKRPVYWYSEPDTRKCWPDKFASVENQSAKA